MSDSKLFEQIQVGNLSLDHRVVFAPCTRMRTLPDGSVAPITKKYYAQRASTRGTLLITESSIIAPKASGYPSLPGIWTDQQVAAWKEASGIFITGGAVVDAVHAEGSYIFAQIIALGRPAALSILQMYDSSYDVVSAGDIAIHGGEKPRALSMDEIKEYISLFTKAATDAVEKAGFDGVEIHGANGYLIDQFLQDVSNNRKDDYGGSVENRTRFALEVVESVSKAIGEKRTAFRISPYATSNDMLMKDPVPTFTHLVTKLKELHPDLAYLHVIEPRVASDQDRVAHESESTEFLQRIWLPKPLVLAGGYTRESALAACQESGVLVAFGRHFMSNPDLPSRLQKNVALTPYDRSTFYGGNERGYTDYPFA